MTEIELINTLTAGARELIFVGLCIYLLFRLFALFQLYREDLRDENAWLRREVEKCNDGKVLSNRILTTQHVRDETL